MLLKEKKKKKRFIIPEIPKGNKARPFSIGNGFTIPENLVRILNNHGFDQNEYDGSFIIPPQIYPERSFLKRFIPWQALLFSNNVIIHAKDTLILNESGTVNKVCANNLAYLKLNHCLLSIKLNIVCSTNEIANQIEVEFSFTSYEILEPNLDRFLKAGLHECKALDGEKSAYDRLKNIPEKYRNGVYAYIIRKDEALLDFIYLPGLVYRFGFIKKSLTPNILFAITGRQLFIFEDDLSCVGLYTRIVTFIPIDNVNSISFEKQKRFTSVIIKIKKDNISEELLFGIEDKYTDDVKSLLTAVIK